jgi:hypothetical protein
MPPNFALQRHTSPVGIPVSDSFSIPVICSAVNRLARIPASCGSPRSSLIGFPGLSFQLDLICGGRTIPGRSEQRTKKTHRRYHFQTKNESDNSVKGCLFRPQPG